MWELLDLINHGMFVEIKDMKNSLFVYFLGYGATVTEKDQLKYSNILMLKYL